MSSIKKLAFSRSEEVGYYRFLNNPKVTEEDLIDSICQETSSSISGGHILALQDTTEFDFLWNKNRKKEFSGLGGCKCFDSLGFLLHPTLTIDASTLEVYGFSHVDIWCRPQGQGNKADRKYKTLPVESKESNKWSKGALQSKPFLEQADMVTFVEDREGDIYKQFCDVPQENIHLLIRSSQNRCLTNGKKLHAHIDDLAVAGEYTQDIVESNSSGYQKRNVEIQVKYDKVILQKPANLKGEEKNSVKVTVVSAEEIAPEKASKPICWRLLTTHEVTSLQDAMQIIQWYSMRWYIEQLFRLLKSKGFQIGRSELESGWAIRKLTIMAMQSALKIMQLKLALQEENELTAKDNFTEGQIKCLEQLNLQYQGKTEKQKNKYKHGSMAWAAWIISRIGGWKGYLSQRPPGFITFKEGYDRFNNIYQGYIMYKNQLVCTP